MAINNTRELISCHLEGRHRSYQWRKTPSPLVSAQGTWYDLSMTPGNPPPKYWFDAPPSTAKAVYQSTDGGIFHGANVSPYTKYIRKMLAVYTPASGLALQYILCDYLLYYPSIDDSNTDPQIMDNTVTLPRCTDGAGVQAIAVSIAARTGGQQFYITYTNSDGVSGRTSQTMTQSVQTPNGTIISSGSVRENGNPFIGLQSGDSGIRSIDSVVMLGADIGLFTLILVKPLATFHLREQGYAYEKDYVSVENSLPIIEDDAYLNLLFVPQNTVAGGTMIGVLDVIWN